MDYYNTTVRSTRKPPRNVSRRIPSQTKPGTSVCGMCDTICIYSATELIFVIGIIANFLVVFRVIVDKKLRKPTFVAVAQLALAEGLFLLFQTVLNVEYILFSILCHVRGEAWTYVNGILAMFWFNAAFHVTLLAAMRYIILAYPFKQLNLLTNKRIIIASLFIWIVSFFIFGSIMLRNKLSTRSEQDQLYIKAITWFLTYFTPIVLTTVLHFVKISVVRKSADIQIDITPHTELRKSSMRMVKIIAIVIIAGALLPLPRFVLVILQEISEVRITNITLRRHLRGVSGLLFLLNYSINPFIYSLSSETFRESLRRMTLSTAAARLQNYKQNTSNTTKQKTSDTTV